MFLSGHVQNFKPVINRLCAIFTCLLLHKYHHLQLTGILNRNPFSKLPLHISHFHHLSLHPTAVYSWLILSMESIPLEFFFPRFSLTFSPPFHSSHLRHHDYSDQWPRKAGGDHQDSRARPCGGQRGVEEEEERRWQQEEEGREWGWRGLRGGKTLSWYNWRLVIKASSLTNAEFLRHCWRINFITHFIRLHNEYLF